MTQPRYAGVTLQVLDECGDPSIDYGGVITTEFHQVDAQGRALRVFREVFGDAMPDNVLHRQQKHLGIHRLDGQWTHADQRTGITQCIHESCVANVDQYRIRGNRQNVQFCFDDEGERSLGTTQNTVEIESAVRLAQVREVVASQAAIEFGKARLDQFALLALDTFRAAVNATNAIRSHQLLRQHGLI
ncbi:hypothetical protein D9M68_444270 [compost metagenome]